jgi:hypothetical protein
VRLNELFNDRSKLVFAQKIYDFPEEIGFLGIYELIPVVFDRNRVGKWLRS